MPDAEASLTDLVFRVKDAFEGADMEGLARLFVPRASVHVLGRSLPVEEFVQQLGELLTQVDRPRLDVVRMEDATIAQDPLSLTCSAEVSLVDRRTQHLGTVPGVLMIRAASVPGEPSPESPESAGGAPSSLLIRELSFKQAA